MKITKLTDMEIFQNLISEMYKELGEIDELRKTNSITIKIGDEELFSSLIKEGSEE